MVKTTTKKNHWSSWKTVVLPKEKEGLVVGCPRVMNVALLAKCVWKFKTERKNICSTCIKACHKIDGIDGKPISMATLPGVLYTIAKVKIDLQEWNVSLDSFMLRMLGMGIDTFFWKDR